MMTITAQDIRRGRKVDPLCCATALAYQRLVEARLPDGMQLDAVMIGDGTCHVDYAATDRLWQATFVADLPIRLVRWIRKFDTRPKAQMTPARFRVPVPDWS